MAQRVSSLLLLTKVSLLVVVTNALLNIFPADRVLRLLFKYCKKARYTYTRYPQYTRRAVWAVNATSKYLVKKKCLVDAVVLFFLLNRKKIESRIMLGYLPVGDQCVSHAWLLGGSEVLIGNSPILNFYLKIPVQTTIHA
jgi:hypothetical protein